VITQWVPLYESNPDAVKSEIATFFQVFPHGTIWSNDIEGQGYDVVLMGQVDATAINVDDVEERLTTVAYGPVKSSLAKVGFESAVELLATYAGRKSDLAGWLEGAEINRDRNLRLQYLAGMGLNSYEQGRIFDSMIAHRQFPQGLFVGSEGGPMVLRRALQGKMFRLAPP
jgi:spermidine synthase